MASAPGATIVRPHVPQFNLKLKGSQAPVEIMNDLLEVMVENSLHLPDVCTMRIHDHQFKWLDSDRFAEGTRVQILGGEGKEELEELFDGEVVGLEMDLAAHGVSTMIVRCLDRSHRLHRGRMARSFVNVKDSDIVKKVGQECGFVVRGDTTKVVHDWVLQNNQTNWEFLTERAARNGFRLFVKGEKDLVFEKVKDRGSKTVELEWGENLRSFRPRTSASSQVNEVVVKGWDPKQKDAIIGKATSPRGIPQTSMSAEGGKIAKKAFGSAKMVVVDRPVMSTDEANELAQSICDEIAGTFLEADGLCNAMPKLKPGATVKIKNIGNRFSGEYFVTSTVHTYTPSEGYVTQFAVSGKSSPNLVSLLGAPGTSMARRSPVGGNIVVGIVTDNKDPEGLGRVKVKYPWLTNEHTSFWARQASQMAGKGRGMFNIPEIDDEVLVAFEHGDVSRPFILGQLWNGKDKMPGLSGANAMHGPSSVTNRRGFYSRIGHKMNFDDSGGKGAIDMISAGGHTLSIDDANRNVSIKTTGNHKVDINDQTKSIGITSTAGHKIEISDAGQTITVSHVAGHKLVMTPASVILTDNAGDMLNMTGGNVVLKASASMTLNAPVINVTGLAAVNIMALATTMTAGAMAAISGGAVTTISGGSLVSVNGAVIKLN